MRPISFKPVVVEVVVVPPVQPQAARVVAVVDRAVRAVLPEPELQQLVVAVAQDYSVLEVPLAQLVRVA